MTNSISDKIKKLFVGSNNQASANLSQKMIFDRMKELAMEGLKDQGPIVLPALGRLIGYLLCIAVAVIASLIIPIVALIVLMFNDKDITFGSEAKHA